MPAPRRRFSLRRLAVRDRGVSYSLSVVLIVPLYLTIMITAVELSLLFLARLGTQYAAHAAARSAVVWLHAQPEELREERIRQAATMALAPYTGGRQREVNDAGPPPPWADQNATDFADAVRLFQAPAASAGITAKRPYDPSRSPPPADFLRRKFLSAAARTTVKVEVADATDPHTLVTVTVTFRSPLYFPVASRFLDPDRSAPFEYPLTATVTLPADGPKSKDGTLGIEYQSLPRGER
jgi:Flp pilus assembly protein TadG